MELIKVNLWAVLLSHGTMLCAMASSSRLNFTQCGQQDNLCHTCCRRYTTCWLLILWACLFPQPDELFITLLMAFGKLVSRGPGQWQPSHSSKCWHWPLPCLVKIKYGCPTGFDPVPAHHTICLWEHNHHKSNELGQSAPNQRHPISLDRLSMCALRQQKC